MCPFECQVYCRSNINYHGVCPKHSFIVAFVTKNINGSIKIRGHVSLWIT